MLSDRVAAAHTTTEGGQGFQRSEAPGNHPADAFGPRGCDANTPGHNRSNLPPALLERPALARDVSSPLPLAGKGAGVRALGITTSAANPPGVKAPEQTTRTTFMSPLARLGLAYWADVTFHPNEARPHFCRPKSAGFPSLTRPLARPPSPAEAGEESCRLFEPKFSSLLQDRYCTWVKCYGPVCSRGLAPTAITLGPLEDEHALLPHPRAFITRSLASGSRCWPDSRAQPGRRAIPRA